MAKPVIIILGRQGMFCRATEIGDPPSPDGRYLAFPKFTFSSNAWMIENLTQDSAKGRVAALALQSGPLGFSRAQSKESFPR